MKYLIKTTRGISFDVDSETVDLDGFFNALNNRQLLAVSMGDIGMSKHNIVNIVPAEEPVNATHTIWTNTGEEIRVKLTEEDTVGDVISRINDRNHDFVKVGDAFLQSRSFDFIAPVEQSE